MSKVCFLLVLFSIYYCGIFETQGAYRLPAFPAVNLSEYYRSLGHSPRNRHHYRRGQHIIPVNTGGRFALPGHSSHKPYNNSFTTNRARNLTTTNTSGTTTFSTTITITIPTTTVTSTLTTPTTTENPTTTILTTTTEKPTTTILTTTTEKPTTTILTTILTTTTEKPTTTTTITTKKSTTSTKMTTNFLISSLDLRFPSYTIINGTGMPEKNGSNTYCGGFFPETGCCTRCKLLGCLHCNCKDFCYCYHCALK